MRKNLIQIIGVVLASASLAVAATAYTPVTAESNNDFSGTNTFDGVTTVNNATINYGSSAIAVASSASNEVTVTYKGVANTTKGQLIIETASTSNDTASADVYQQIFRAPDSLNNDTDYCTLEVTLVDVSTGTEDGRLTIAVMVAGTDTDILEVDATGLWPTTTATFDLGKSGKLFKDLHLSGVVRMDGTGGTNGTFIIDGEGGTNLTFTVNGGVITACVITP